MVRETVSCAGITSWKRAELVERPTWYALRFVRFPTHRFFRTDQFAVTVYGDQLTKLKNRTSTMFLIGSTRSGVGARGGAWTVVPRPRGSRGD